MKTLLILSALILSSASLAADKCYQQIDQKLIEDSAQTSDWGYDGLQITTQKDALEMLDNALVDLNESQEAIDDAKKIAAKDGVLFYSLFWNAPSNSGTSLILVDAATCETLKEIGIWSEE